MAYSPIPVQPTGTVRRRRRRVAGGLGDWLDFADFIDDAADAALDFGSIDFGADFAGDFDFSLDVDALPDLDLGSSVDFGGVDFDNFDWGTMDAGGWTEFNVNPDQLDLTGNWTPDSLVDFGDQLTPADWDLSPVDFGTDQSFFGNTIDQAGNVLPSIPKPPGGLPSTPSSSPAPVKSLPASSSAGSGLTSSDFAKAAAAAATAAAAYFKLNPATTTPRALTLPNGSRIVTAPDGRQLLVDANGRVISSAGGGGAMDKLKTFVSANPMVAAVAGVGILFLFARPESKGRKS